MSKRKSPALVGVVNGDRVLGEEAFSLAIRYPNTIFGRARDLLGRTKDDPLVKAMLAEHFLPYEVIDHEVRRTAAVKVNDTAAFLAEELVASVLQYARTITEAQSGGPVPDAVITVPAWFGVAQRRALLDSAAVAGINVLSLINTHSAAALQYGIERDFSKGEQKVVFYDVGSSSTEVALVKYSTFNTKELGKPKPVNQFEVLDVEWDAQLGGNSLDMLLANHFAVEFNEKNKLGEDVRDFPRAMAKLKRQVRRTKEVLSANTGAPFSVEELHQGRDFQSSIKRETLEALAGDFWQRAAAPLQRLLERNGLKGSDLDAVELLGGGSRVPKLQAVLQDTLGGRALDRHLDADEAVVLGAALFAANLSTSFRLRKFGMADMSMFGVQYEPVGLLVQPKDGDGEEAAAAAQPAGPKSLLPAGKKLPVKRTIKYTNLTQDAFSFKLAYNSSTPHGLPPGVSDPLLGSFDVSGIEDAIKRYNFSGTTSLKFDADYSGVLRVDKAECVVEMEVQEEVTVEVPEERNTTESSGEADDAEAKGGEEGAGKGDSAATDDASAGDADGSKGDGEKGTAAANEDGDEADADKADGEKDDADKADADKVDADKADADKDDGEKDDSDKVDGEKDGGEKADADKDGENKDETGKEGGDRDGDKDGGKKTGDAAKDKVKPKPKLVKKTILVPRKKTFKVALKVGGPGWVQAPLSGPELSAARETVTAWAAKEAVKKATAKAKNDLESYILAQRDALEGEELLKVTTEEQRSSFSSELMDAEDWLYGDGEAEAAPAFIARLTALQAIGNPISRRAQELGMRLKLLDSVENATKSTLEVINSWKAEKPWIDEEEVAQCLEQVKEFGEWLAGKVSEQSKKADHEEPVLLASEVLAKWEGVHKKVSKVGSKRKPKPPPAPSSNATDAEGKAEEGGKAAEEGSKTEEGGKGKDSKGKDSGTNGKGKDSKDKDSKGKDSKAKGKDTKAKGKDSKRSTKAGRGSKKTGRDDDLDYHDEL